jgi:hypothetical protein
MVIAFAGRGSDRRAMQAGLDRHSVPWTLGFFTTISNGINSPLVHPDVELGIVVEVLREGNKLEVTSEAPWRGEGPFRYDDTRQVAYRVDRPLADGGFLAGERSHDESLSLRQLEDGLLSTRDAGRAVRATVDAQPGSVYSDMTALIESLTRGGVTDVVFVGARERR